MSASGHFFHARQSSEILPDKLVLKPNRTKRALHERTPSEINREIGHPTIRLVDPDSSSPNVYEKTPFPKLPSQVLKPPRTTKHGYTVQDDAGTLDHHARLRDSSVSPTKKRSSKLFPQALNFGKSNRYSASTTTSNADTLLNDSLFSPVSNRFSMDGTLRNTPTPFEMEERERENERALEALEEHPAGPSTIRPVTASSGSGSTDRATAARESDDEFSIHPAFRQSVPIFPRQNNTRLSLIESVDTPISSPNPQEPSSEYSSGDSSSSPDPARSSSYNIIRYTTNTSEGSAPVQYAQVRPATAQSQSAESWSATESDSLPPLSVPRRRQHMYSASAGVSYAQIQPLSTIASESEPASRTHTRSQFSHGSSDVFRSAARPHQQLRHRRSKTLGSSSYNSNSSGVNETFSAENSMADLTGFSMMRAESAVPVPLFSSSSHMGVYELAGDIPSNETEEERGDTIAELQAPVLRKQQSGYLNRRHSISDARPESSRSNQAMGESNRASQGSFIFPQWARQFYKGRAQLASANASRASLSRTDSQAFSTRSPVRMMPWAHHRRFESGWESYNSADGSVFSSRPGTVRSGGFPNVSSPEGSSHFLPSIFRPYARRRAYTDITAASSSHPSDEFYDETSGSEQGSDRSDSRLSRRDSMEITPAPPRPGHNYAVRHPSPLASGQTRKKSRRKQRRQHTDLDRDNTFSTTLSANDILGGAPPRLAPSRRLSNRISAWRAPSFDEALSSLLKTRQNRQILFFCLGFICPVLWMVAAFLPIPSRPLDARVSDFTRTGGMNEDGTKTEMGGTQYSVQMDMFDWEQEKRYLKARWWRNLNRIMSFVGVGVIVAIIVLAVVASK